MNMFCNSIEVTLSYGCFLGNLLHISRTPFYKNTFEGLLLLLNQLLFILLLKKTTKVRFNNKTLKKN